MTTELDGPRLAPVSGHAPTALVVLLHGYGADGNDLIALGREWQRLLPDVAFVAPNAPERVPPFGYQWFSLDDYDPAVLRRDPPPAHPLLRSMKAGMERVAPRLNAFLDDEIDRAGVASDRLAIVGFSQGTMLGLHVALWRRPSPLCVVGYSGGLVGADSLKDDLAGRPSVLLVHGEGDDVVPVAASRRAEADLKALDVPVELHVIAGLGHGIDGAGLALGGKFLRRNIDAGATN